MEKTDRSLRALLIVLCAALALVVAGNSALAITLPSIANDLGADQGELTWVIDAYALTFAALLLSAGIAADRFGRRTTLAGGLLVIGVSCTASGFTSSPEGLIALRAIAGIGAAAVFPVTLSALVDAYPAERRGFAVAVWSGVSAAGAVLGTLAAGGLLEWFWWGSVQVAFGLAALVLLPPVVRLVAQNSDRSLSLDPWGALWSTVALAAIVVGVIEAPQRGWTDPWTVTALVVGLLGVLAFVRHELRTREPSLDVRLFLDRGLAAGALLVTLQFFASLALFVLAPQYLQVVRGYTPLGAAVALLAIPVGVGLGTGMAPPLLASRGARLPGAVGMLLMAGGFAAIAFTLGRGGNPAALMTWWLPAGGLVLFGIGFGLAITPGTVLILEGLPAERRSVASAVNDITREVGGVLGIAVLSSILIGSYRDALGGAVQTLPAPVRAAAADGAAAALGIAPSLPEAQSRLLVDAARDAFVAGFGTSLWAGSAVLVVGAAICGALAPPRTSPRET
jgi:EmrB/QacA subfamily drug resistance transporter